MPRNNHSNNHGPSSITHTQTLLPHTTSTRHIHTPHPHHISRTGRTTPHHTTPDTPHHTRHTTPQHPFLIHPTRCARPKEENRPLLSIHPCWQPIMSCPFPPFSPCHAFLAPFLWTSKNLTLSFSIPFCFFALFFSFLFVYGLAWFLDLAVPASGILLVLGEKGKGGGGKKGGVEGLFCLDPKKRTIRPAVVCWLSSFFFLVDGWPFLPNFPDLYSTLLFGNLGLLA